MCSYFSSIRLSHGIQHWCIENGADSNLSGLYFPVYLFSFVISTASIHNEHPIALKAAQYNIEQAN